MSNELQKLSRDIIKTIEKEDKEYEFQQNKSYVERNVPALKYKKNVVGLDVSDFEEIISK